MPKRPCVFVIKSPVSSAQLLIGALSDLTCNCHNHHSRVCLGS
jgi:hypothetical protein